MVLQSEKHYSNAVKGLQSSCERPPSKVRKAIFCMTKGHLSARKESAPAARKAIKL